MEEVPIGAVTLDRCTSCQGVWFDAMEREQLLTLPGAADALDTECIWERQPPDSGALTESPGGYRGAQCPRCAVKMEPVWVRRQKNAERGTLVFEQCENCQGSFFDAGEFSDLAGP
ncbi:MAG: hypothetical protein CMO64_05370 [Verrucomicrobiales bacterium]|nr:hypothetical protein [Verrucomicrobiales bacterium]